MAPLPKSQLYTQLSTSTGKDELHAGRKYIPVDVVIKIITKDNIKAELGRKPGNRITLWGCLADKVVKKNAKRLFAILVYINQAWDVKELLNRGFTDEDLPLAQHEEELRSTHDSTKIFNTAAFWEDRTVDDFLAKQWMVLAPVFSISGKHMILDPECPLPFSKLDEAAPGRSVVYQAKVDPSHQEGFEAEAPSLQVALKEFKSKEDFEQERDNLKKIRGVEKNEHITQYLATFSQGNKYYIIFPWAEGGDLDNFWEHGSSKSRTPQLTLWCLRQMLGLAEALHALHQGIDDKANCRHGDLKPGNILHFLTEGEGILKITDFGISRIHNTATHQRMGKPTTTRATTPSYEAPEAVPALSKKQSRSRKYDIWSLGCIFLEFTIWIVRGWEGVQSFNSARKPKSSGPEIWALFYQITNDTAQVHPEVIRKITDLKGLTQSKEGTALGELLDLIEINLLEVEVEHRLDATQLCSRLRSIAQKAESDSVYLSNNGASAAVG